MSALTDQTVLLTGASGGIGMALCEALVKAGARVLAVGRNEQKLRELAAQHPFGKVLWVKADLASPDGPAQVVAAAERVQPTPSIVVMAHAQSAFNLFEDQSPEMLQQLVQVNLQAPMMLVHGLLPLLKRHANASVVAIGSTFGSLAFPGFAAYSATKFGLRGLMEGLAREYGDSALRFQYLSPRATRTAFNSPQVEAMNREMKVSQDDPADVAAQLVDAIVRGDRRMQIGWPEKLFARLNGALPGLVDRNLIAQLPIVRRHARS
ncbi:short chain dehydrogenase [Ahniella affigens]|uniref:Short chain dehydrogenase n=1 Tax=Ahniella affigens TaxID=2021234 RepID=A0A2P1PQZ4_9GAMM|nr:SDR family oxidoreductase [Ahniella affigens]AVP97273.1 short chain dehydrogenase [Ahniella affigens]